MLYNYAGRPDKSADIVHLLLEKAFTDSRAGIPGNDDSGAMSSWLIFQTLGIYPVAGQDVYLISTPSLPDASLMLGNGKVLRIVAKNLDGSGLKPLCAVGDAEWEAVAELVVPAWGYQGRGDAGVHAGVGAFGVGQGCAVAFDERCFVQGMRDGGARSLSFRWTWTFRRCVRACPN